MDFWVEESNHGLSIPVKRKRMVRSRKIEFIGWGSKPLIEFLDSIGKDSSKELSQYEVEEIINKYINENNLLHPNKKKKVQCDERLLTLFGRKVISRVKIYDLLEAHFAENNDESEDEYSSLDDDNAKTEYKRKKISSANGQTPSQKKNVVESPKSCFAAIIPENMKRIYLKRSLVQELLKDTVSFERKVVGSYVRVKSDPNDYLQKNSHQLVQVRGVKRVLGTGGADEVFLQLPNMMKDIPVCKLSDDNFSEEECKDLHERVKTRVQKRHTLVELQEKTQMLHEDITRHWLVKEVALLQNLIDRANEKGWRRELFEYLERKKLLQTPSEQSRLLLEVPKIIAEELEPVAIVQDPIENVKEGNNSPVTAIRANLDVRKHDLEANLDASGPGDVVIVSQAIISDLCTGNEGCRDFIVEAQSTKEPEEDQSVDFVRQQRLSGEIRNEPNGAEQLVNPRKNDESHGSSDKRVQDGNVIVLSDDDEEEKNQCGIRLIVDHPKSSIWYYVDPQGCVQGPFSMAALKRWSDLDYFPSSFKVWKRGQSQDEAVLLKDMIRSILPC